MTEPALTIDATGRRCPLPVLDLARRIGEVAVGDVVAVRADDPAAATDIPAWCRMRQQEYVGSEPDAAGVPAYLVRRLR
ncbi:MAG TPA: sulfurtransferase TusA family protein [Mycobacteriales bacterium]|nr:sulfurtransferase TusA family protein [Mycobacteriales bacterium]